MATARADTSPSDRAFAALDTAQAEAAGLLEELHRTLASTPAPRRPRGWLGKMRARFGRPVEPIRGLYLWGGVGRGKTYLMDWFADGLALAGKRRVHFHHFMRDAHDGLSRLPRQPDPLEVLAERLSRETRVLCLDEFIVHDIADAMILYGLLKGLFDRGVTLVTTSNTLPDDLYRNGLQRQRFVPAIALLNRHTQVFELAGGTDYRLQRLSRAGCYFLTGEADADAGLAGYFETITGGHLAAADAILIDDREIAVRRLGKDVVWFDFAELCDKPRSTAIYLEIAQEYHTVLVSDVPVLSAAWDAAARRFLHLVDAFYDRKVKLILSAAAPLDELYNGGLHDFAYARMKSRLTEMQTHEYLACAHQP